MNEGLPFLEINTFAWTYGLNQKTIRRAISKGHLAAFLIEERYFIDSNYVTEAAAAAGMSPAAWVKKQCNMASGYRQSVY